MSIFDMDIESPKKEPEPSPTPAKASVESRVDEIFSRLAEAPQRAPPAPSPPVKEQPRVEPVVPTEVQAPPPEKRKAPEPAKAPEPQKPVPPEPEPEQMFECPACKSRIPVSATVCPKCGVMFAEEGAEMFQCPACNTLVSVDAKSCPGCGAMFVEPGEAEPSVPVSSPAPEVSAAAVELEKKDLEPPIEEVKEEKATEPKVKEPEKVEKKWMRWLRWGRKEEPKVEPTPEPEPKTEKIAVSHAPAKPAGEPIREVKLRVKETTPMEAGPAPPRAPSPAAAAPASPDKGEQLALMVAEWKPLFALASEKEVDTADSKQLIDEAIVAGRERQIDKAIELVQKSKTILTEKVDAHLGHLIGKLNDEIGVARDFGGDISRATTYMQEVARARVSGDAEAAYVYVEKVQKELLPITGRYNESRAKVSDLKALIQDCEMFIVDTKEARRILVEASRSFESKDFDKVDALVKSANDSLYKVIPVRMTEEMKKAKDGLIDAKAKNANITPMLTVLKSATSMMKTGNYAQAIREMRAFKDMMKKVS